MIQALQFVGALADAQQPGEVSIIAFDVQLFRVAVGTVNAGGLHGVFNRRLAGEQLGHTGFHVAALARRRQARARPVQPTATPPRPGVAMSANLS